MFDIANYEEASSVRQAVELLAADPKARLIAGGTDILLHIREGKLPDARLVSIHGLAELRGVVCEADGTIIIKPVTSFSEVSAHPVVQQHLPFLAEAADSVGGPQIRHVATIGGNICNGATSADSAPMLFALNARLRIAGPSGIRELPIRDFYKGPGKVDLAHGEVLTAIVIQPPDYHGFGGHYIKYAMRNAMDIATLSCAVLCRPGENNTVAELRLALGVANPTPLRCPKAEAAAGGQRFSQSLVDEIARLAAGEVNPRTSWRASKEYRLQLVEELSKRAFREAWLRAGGELA